MKKRCNTCEQHFEPNELVKGRRLCYPCQSKKMKAYYQANREDRIAYQKNYHKEKVYQQYQ